LIVTTKVDDSEWEAGIDLLVVAMQRAGREASLAGAQEIADVTKVKLSEHPHSSLTWSPTAPGEPPGMVSSHLALSIDAEMVTEDQAWVGPTNLDYARIQELGGGMHGHPRMRYRKLTVDGLRTFTPEFVELKPRPYLRPSSDDVIESGRLTEIYIEHWTAAIEEVTG
jgi:phage gpG-like protein